MSRLVLALLLVGFVWPAAAQPPQPARRPKIGLALSGGSAKGLSHVGVLKWFQENKIPIDYIGGTSMGGLIAGAYASGMSPNEIEQLLGGVDWPQTLALSPPYRQLSFRRKEDAREYPTALVLGYKKGVKLPPGISPGEGVDLLLSSFAAPYENMKSFNDLPTPFRCVATSLNTAKKKVFDSGSMYEALRSTMSLPLLFAPQTEGQDTYVDGGLVENIPVEAVKAMGADIVIAVAFDSPPDPAAYQTLFGLAGRSIDVAILQNERTSLAMADMVIVPDLKGLGSSDYQKWSEFDQRGYEAAQGKRAMLSRFAVDETVYQQILTARASKRLPTEIKPDFVEVAGDLAPKRKATLIKALSRNDGKPLSPQLLEQEMNRLVGLGLFDQATYVYERRGSEIGLKIKLHEKTYGPPFLQLLPSIDGATQDGLRFNISGRLTFLDFGGPASEWRTDFSIGTVNLFSTEYYYRIKGSKYFFSGSYLLNDSTRPLYAGTSKDIGTYNVTTNVAKLDVGYAYGRFQELRAGYSLGRVSVSQDTGVAIFNPYDGRANDVHVRWIYDHQNNPIIPTDGVYARVNGYYGLSFPNAPKDYPGADARISFAKAFNEKWSFWGNTSMGITRQEQALAVLYPLGGVLRLSALARDELTGSRFYFGSGYMLRRLNPGSLAFLGKFYGAIGYETGNAWTTGPWPVPRQTGAVGLMGDTPLGFVYFGAAYGDRGARNLFFRLGRQF